MANMNNIHKTTNNNNNQNPYPYTYSPLRNPYNVPNQIFTYERLSWVYIVFYCVTMFNIIFSIIDVLLSFSDFDCRNIINPEMPSLTIGTWLQVSGFFGICYSILTTISVFYIVQFLEYNDHHRKCQCGIKILYGCCVVFIVAWNMFGIYIFFSYYQSVCNVKMITDYMWVRLSLGLVVNFGSFVIAFCSNFLVTDSNIRSYFYSITTE